MIEYYSDNILYLIFMNCPRRHTNKKQIRVISDFFQINDHIPITVVVFDMTIIV